MKLSDMALTIMKDRYSLRDEDGEPYETPDEIINRVANWASTDMFEFKIFRRLIQDMRFLPNTPTWINADNDRQGTKSACFTFDVKDDLIDIFHVLGTKAAKITQQGGGVGFNLSKIRPRGDLVRSSGKVASGPVDFMKIINTTIDVVSQGGVRRGAVMCMLDDNHPDIYEFIECKTKDESTLTNMNLSVLVSSYLLKLASEEIKNDTYDTNWILINPRTGTEQSKTSARKLLETIAKASLVYGEPGVVFKDNIENNNTVPGLGELRIVNPCAEYPGFDNESCTLGSINLAEHVLPDGSDWDYELLGPTVYHAVSFLDNTISKNDYAFPEIEEATKRTRKIGLGVMGYATALFKMKVRYGSKRALELAYDVMSFINKKAVERSVHIASIKGSFPAHDLSIYNHPMRNATVTTIAPTGTISKIAQVSGGIEPVFNFVVTYYILGGKKIVDYDPVFISECQKHNISPELVSQAVEKGSIQDLPFPDEMKEYFVTSYDLKPEHHLKTQGTFQMNTHNAVSKTINMPGKTSYQNIVDIILSAHSMGIKGMTVYVDKSREKQVLNSDPIEPKKISRLYAMSSRSLPSHSVNVNTESFIKYPTPSDVSMPDISHCPSGRCNL